MTSPTSDQSTMADRIAGFMDHYSLLVGDEKGEAQVFLDRFFQALGHKGVREAGAVLEDRVRGEGSVHFADLMWDGRRALRDEEAGRGPQEPLHAS